MLDIDITALYQIIGFFFLLFIVTRFLTRPVLRILDERSARTSGTIKDAARIDEEVAAGLIGYEQKLKDATLAGMETRTALRAEARKAEQVALDAARKEANERLGSIRGEIAKGKADVMARLKEDAAAISREIAEKVLERKLLAIIVPILMLSLPAIAMAATGEGGGEEHGSSGMGWKIFNFALLVIGVYFAWTKAISKMLDKRGSDIKAAMDEAAKVKAAAEAKKKEYEEKLALLDSRIRHIQDELRLEGEAEKEKIAAEAKESAERIIAQAKLVADQEVQKAKDELRREAAELSMGMAEELLKKELTAADQKRLVGDYLSKLRVN
jgi:F-type H+-transporting ATPase subunit b